MKYFLGYETTDRKIVKIDNNGIVDASTDLFDIVDFTMKFDSLRNLKKELYSKSCRMVVMQTSMKKLFSGCRIL